MFIDILIALLFAVVIELVYNFSTIMKPIIIIFFCICSIIIYFISGCQLDFIGAMDFSIWLMLIILFNQISIIIIRKIWKNMKDDDY